MYLVMHCTNLCIIAVFILADIHSWELVAGGACDLSVQQLGGEWAREHLEHGAVFLRVKSRVPRRWQINNYTNIIFGAKQNNITRNIFSM